jgi:hypothetical protein
MPFGMCRVPGGIEGNIHSPCGRNAGPDRLTAGNTKPDARVQRGPDPELAESHEIEERPGTGCKTPERIDF